MNGQESPETTSPIRSAVLGVLLTAGLHAAAGLLALAPLSLLFSRNGGWFLFWIYIGAVQWVYLVPAILIARRRQKKGLAKGLFLGGVVTLLLNGLCWGSVLLLLSGKL